MKTSFPSHWSKMCVAICLAASFSTAPLLAHLPAKYYYDAGGRLTYIDHFAGRSIEFVYDSSGNLLRKTVIVFTDADSDQMNDAWEQQYFGGLSRTGTADQDNDGLSDAEEFLAGTDPTDAQSVLKSTLSKETDGKYTVEWPTVPGRRYLLQYKDDLNDPVWINAFDPFVAGSTHHLFLDTTSNGMTKRFYRLLIVPET